MQRSGFTSAVLAADVNADMIDLEAKLKEADSAGAKIKMIATDGVFSMDEFIANLKEICNLADKYEAFVMVDDSYVTGFVGKHGKGTQKYCDVMGRVDIIGSAFVCCLVFLSSSRTAMP